MLQDESLSPLQGHSFQLGYPSTCYQGGGAETAHGVCRTHKWPQNIPGLCGSSGSCAVWGGGAAGSGWQTGLCEVLPCGLQGLHAGSFPSGALNEIWAPPEQRLEGGAWLHPGPAVLRLLAGLPSSLL